MLCARFFNLLQVKPTLRLHMNSSQFSSSSIALNIEQWLQSLKNNIGFSQLNELPVDRIVSAHMNKKPRLIKDAIFTEVHPTPLKAAHIISYSNSCFKQCLNLDLESHEIKTDHTFDHSSISSLLQMFNGNMEMIHKYIPDCTPYSHCYAGYQFGSFAGQLGKKYLHFCLTFKCISLS